MKFEIDTNRLKTQLKEVNPLVVVGLVAGVLSGGAKVMNANTNRKNAKTWRREVSRREKNVKK